MRGAPRPGALPRLVGLIGVIGVVAGSGLIAAVVAGELPSDDTGTATAGGSTSGSADVVGTPIVERPARPDGAPAVVARPPSPPVRVEIPSIGVSSGLQALGLDGDGAIGAPSDFGVAGWFAAGPQPGQAGPAVIAGHVDSREGPAVFYRLHELAVGDEVLVVREDGGLVRFRVTGSQTYPKDEFPSAAVYGPVPGPELRLITCDGPFDRSTRQYVDNLVIYAALA